MSSDFVGWNRDELIAEVTRLRRELKQMHLRFDRYVYAAEEHWRDEAYERAKQGIYG